MKSLPAGMQAHLDDGTTTLAWCWRIERADGALYPAKRLGRDRVVPDRG